MCPALVSGKIRIENPTPQLSHLGCVEHIHIWCIDLQQCCARSFRTGIKDRFSFLLNLETSFLYKFLWFRRNGFPLDLLDWNGSLP